MLARPATQAQFSPGEAKGELYNLRDDPHEWKNRYADPACAGVRERMKTELLMHLACAWASFPAGRG